MINFLPNIPNNYDSYYWIIPLKNFKSGTQPYRVLMHMGDGKPRLRTDMYLEIGLKANNRSSANGAAFRLYKSGLLNVVGTSKRTKIMQISKLGYALVQIEKMRLKYGKSN